MSQLGSSLDSSPPPSTHTAMPPLSLHAHGILPRDPPSPDANRSQPPLSMSPSLIVGICILAAMFFCVLLAAVIRLCSRRGAGPENMENLFKPDHPTQIARLHEVKRINNKMAWERGQWARVELVRQGRRMTGYGMGGESWESLENGYNAARQSLHPSPRQYAQAAYRNSDMNPYARASRVSKMMQARRTKHRADDSDDDDDIDMEAFPHLQCLPMYATRRQELMRTTPGGSSDDSSGKASSGKAKETLQLRRAPANLDESQAYLGPAIAKMSSGLNDDGNRQARPPPTPPLHQYQQSQPRRHLTPDPSPTQSTTLLPAGNPADFQDISFDNKQHHVDPISPISDDVKSDTTIKARPVSYQEDYTTLQAPTPLRSPAPEPGPARNETVIHHGAGGHDGQRRGPIIMINDDAHDTEDGRRTMSVSKDMSTTTNYHPSYPLVNVGYEAGVGDIDEMEVFEPREAGFVGGRYFNTGGAAGRGL